MPHRPTERDEGSIRRKGARLGLSAERRVQGESGAGRLGKRLDARPRGRAKQADPLDAAGRVLLAAPGVWLHDGRMASHLDPMPRAKLLNTARPRLRAGRTTAGSPHPLDLSRWTTRAAGPPGSTAACRRPLGAEHASGRYRQVRRGCRAGSGPTQPSCGRASSGSSISSQIAFTIRWVRVRTTVGFHAGSSSRASAVEYPASSGRRLRRMASFSS